MGVDANTGLPGKPGGLTRNAVMPLWRSHTPARVRVESAWAKALELVALNSFQHTVAAYELGTEVLWTQMAKHRLETHAQIDYWMASEGTRGHAGARSLTPKTFR